MGPLILAFLPLAGTKYANGRILGRVSSLGGNLLGELASEMKLGVGGCRIPWVM